MNNKCQALTTFKVYIMLFTSLKVLNLVYSLFITSENPIIVKYKYTLFDFLTNVFGLLCKLISSWHNFQSCRHETSFEQKNSFLLAGFESLLPLYFQFCRVEISLGQRFTEPLVFFCQPVSCIFSMLGT